jgi:hypothetical protein
MNSISGLILAWFVQDVQRFSEESLRTKVKEERKEHAVLLSVLLIMAGGGRSAGNADGRHSVHLDSIED